MSVDDSYTKSLLHFGGADASQTFTDESGKAWTAAGNAQIDTAQSKFDGSSSLFDGTGDAITTPHHADFDNADGAFTIDGWVRVSALPTDGNFAAIVSKRANTSAYAPFTVAIYNNAGSYELRCRASAGSAWDVETIDAITCNLNTWYHFAFVRSGNDFMGFWGGTKGTPVTSAITVVNNNTVAVSIGGNADASQPIAAWVDEVRFSKGIARWTANFTPRSHRYEPAPPIVCFF